jgi:FlaA1/EpsC-like NDP-sugar epimerase
MPSILIIGATGVIGKYITKQILLAQASLGHIAILTSENTVKTKSDQINSLKEKGAEVFVGDLTKEDDVKKAYQGTSP